MVILLLWVRDIAGILNTGEMQFDKVFATCCPTIFGAPNDFGVENAIGFAPFLGWETHHSTLSFSNQDVTDAMSSTGALESIYSSLPLKVLWTGLLRLNDVPSECLLVLSISW